jgi:F-type H+-transporting ATPase subunit gamma
MASMLTIKSRIKSVRSTQQITNAMNLVAASKLQKARSKIADTKPYFNETIRVISSIVNNSKSVSHPYLNTREVKNILVILITGDRGLCGGYNSNACKAAASVLGNLENISYITLGSKGRDFVNRRGKTPIKTIVGISEQPTYEHAAEIGSLILQKFKNSEFDEVYIAFTEFVSTMTHTARVEKILPVDTSKFEISTDETPTLIMNYEPDEESVLNYVIPKYINTVIFGALVQSSACEQGARMTSMDAATENASDMIGKLSLVYNRARQGAITQEINEIVSGANALE